MVIWLYNILFNLPLSVRQNKKNNRLQVLTGCLVLGKEGKTYHSLFVVKSKEVLILTWQEECGSLDKGSECPKNAIKKNGITVDGRHF